jgi:hypothetical protein
MIGEMVRYYLFRDGNSHNPHCVPLRVDSSGVADMSERYAFHEFRGTQRHIAIPVDPDLRVFEVALDDKKEVTAYSISYAGSPTDKDAGIFFARVSKRQALKILKESKLWEMVHEFPNSDYDRRDKEDYKMI